MLLLLPWAYFFTNSINPLFTIKSECKGRLRNRAGRKPHAGVQLCHAWRGSDFSSFRPSVVPGMVQIGLETWLEMASSSQQPPACFLQIKTPNTCQFPKVICLKELSPKQKALLIFPFAATRLLEE